MYTGYWNVTYSPIVNDNILSAEACANLCSLNIECYGFLYAHTRTTDVTGVGPFYPGTCRFVISPPDASANTMRQYYYLNYCGMGKFIK